MYHAQICIQYGGGASETVDDSVSKLMNCALKIRNFVLKTMNSAGWTTRSLYIHAGDWGPNFNFTLPTAIYHPRHGRGPVPAASPIDAGRPAAAKINLKIDHDFWSPTLRTTLRSSLRDAYVMHT